MIKREAVVATDRYKLDTDILVAHLLELLMKEQIDALGNQKQRALELAKQRWLILFIKVLIEGITQK